MAENNEIEDPGRREAFKTAVRVAAPVAVVGIASAQGATEKSGGIFSALGGLINRIGQRKNEVTADQKTAEWRRIVEVLKRMPLSSEQQEALERFRQTPPDKILHNLVVTGQDGAHVRRLPMSYTMEQGADAGLVGKLNPGSVVPEVIEVPGQDPQFVGNPRMEKTWYFAPNDEKTGGAFIYSGNLSILKTATSPNQTGN